MIKFLLTRLLPVGASVAIFGSALSPVQPTLNLFATAAAALAGETAQETDVSGLDPSSTGKSQTAPRKQLPGERRKKLEALADQLGKSDEDTFGWKAGDRGAKPLAPQKK